MNINVYIHVNVHSYVHPQKARASVKMNEYLRCYTQCCGKTDKFTFTTESSKGTFQRGHFRESAVHSVVARWTYASSKAL